MSFFPSYSFRTLYFLSPQRREELTGQSTQLRQWQEVFCYHPIPPVKCPPSVPLRGHVQYPPQPAGCSMVLLGPFTCHPKVLPPRRPKYPATESWHRRALWACLWGSGSVQRPSKPCIPVDASCSLRSPLPAHHLHPQLPLAHQLLSSPPSKLPLSQESPLCSTSLCPLHLALTDSRLFQKTQCPQQPLQRWRFSLSPLVWNTCCTVCPVLGILWVVTHFTLSTAPLCRWANGVLRGESRFIPVAAWQRLCSSPSANTLLHSGELLQGYRAVSSLGTWTSLLGMPPH